MTPALEEELSREGSHAGTEGIDNSRSRQNNDGSKSGNSGNSSNNNGKQPATVPGTA